MSTKARKESKIRRYIKAPGRALSKARDFYVRSLSNCAGNVSYGGAAAFSTHQMAPLPRSFSATSSASSHDEDLRELIRAASTKSVGNKMKLELLQRQLQAKQSPVGGVNVVPRSHTVAIGRIDEDKPFESGDVEVNLDVYARSRSVAVSKRGRMM